MNNEKKYGKKWYSRYLTLAIGCSILSISFIIMFIYFLLIENIFDIVLNCFFLIMFLFSSVSAVMAFIKCKQIKKDIDNSNI